MIEMNICIRKLSVKSEILIDVEVKTIILVKICNYI